MIYDATVVEFTKILTNLDGMIDKAIHFSEMKKIDSQVLLTSRLAPDQFHFIRQVQIACDSAKLSVARLTEKPAPKHEDTETTAEELKARIASTLAFLATIKAADFAGFETRKVLLPWWGGKHMLGFDFAMQYAIPNVYFHVTTAYAILRHNGVDVGKADYLGALPLHD